jgi:hypothetical protein
MTTRERMVAIDPDEASATEEYPNNIRPGESDYDETAPIWGVWEAGVGSPPDGEYGWCPVGPFGLTAEQAYEEMSRLDAEPDITWPSLVDLLQKVKSPSSDPDWLDRFQRQVVWEVNNLDAVDAFDKWEDPDRLNEYLNLIGVQWDEVSCSTVPGQGIQ